MEDRRYAVLRGALIAIGATAFGFLLSQRQPVAYVVAGIAVQVALGAGHALIRRRVQDETVASQARMLLELVGDGASVLLFALGTFRGLSTFSDL